MSLDNNSYDDLLAVQELLRSLGYIEVPNELQFRINNLKVRAAKAKADALREAKAMALYSAYRQEVLKFYAERGGGLGLNVGRVIPWGELQDGFKEGWILVSELVCKVDL